MQLRNVLLIATGLALVGAAGVRAEAQNQAPFTIRRPPDGATVREKVKVQIPLGSIPDGGYVAMYIDGEFRGAIPVSDDDREEMMKAAAKRNEPAYFTYVWDTKAPVRAKFSTKATSPADGEHEILARLYAPRPNSSTGGSILKETTSVKVNVANKLDSSNVGAIKLSYRYRDGDSKDYARTGTSAIVAGLTQGLNRSDDQELVSYKSDLAVGIEDKYPNGNAIVRNNMRTLEVRQSGQSTVYPSNSLPTALYQELDPFGHVVYQNSTVSFDQFALLGVPVSATLELPILPKNAVSVGDTWSTQHVSLEIPGTAPENQPKVTVESKLEGIEWEGGYPTAKIHQTYDSSKAGGLKAKSIIFGTTEVDSPSIKMDQDIYIAYRSGTLVKVVRNLEVVGKTTSEIAGGGGAPGIGAGGTSAMGSGSGGMMQQMMGGGKMGGPAGLAGMGAGGTGSSGMMQRMMGGRGGSASGGMMQQMMGGRGGVGGKGRGAGPGGMQLGGMGGPAGPAGAGSGGGMMQRMMGGPGGAGMGGSSGPGAGTGMASQQITLKATVVTELKAPVQQAGR